MRLARELGRPPTQAEFCVATGLHPLTVRRRLGRYGRWKDIARRALDNPEPPSEGTAEASEDQRRRAAREAIEAVRRRLGWTPGKHAYEAFRPKGAPTANTIARWFGGGRWSAALRALGFEVSPRGPRALPREVVLRALAQLWRELGREPTMADIAAAVGRIPGLLHPSQYHRRFGSVSRAREEARAFLETVDPRRGAPDGNA